MVEATITLEALQGHITKMGQDLLAGYSKQLVEGVAPKLVTAAQENKPTATVDGKPVDPANVALLKQDGVVGAAMKAPSIAGILDSGDNFKIPFVGLSLGPVVSAVAGGAAGLLAGDLIDKKILPWKDAAGVAVAVKPLTGGGPNYLALGAHVGAAAVAYTFAPRFVGRTAATFIAGSLVLKMALRYSPLQSWLINLENKLVGIPASTGINFLQQNQQAALQQQAMQAQQTANAAALANRFSGRSPVSSGGFGW